MTGVFRSPIGAWLTFFSTTVVLVLASSDPAGAAAPNLPGRIVISQENLYDGCDIHNCPTPGYWSLWAGPPAQRPVKLFRLGRRRSWHPPMEPALSANGRRIAYYHYKRGVSVIRVDRRFRIVGRARRVPLGLKVRRFRLLGAAWSPGGSRLAFVAIVEGVKTMFTQKLDGTGVRTLVRGAPLRRGDSKRIAWSSTGEIAFSGTERALWAIAADGGTPRRLTEPPGQDCDDSAAWSTDGRSLMFLRAVEDETSADFEAGQIVMLASVSGAVQPPRRIGPGLAGGLSPDGRWVMTLSVDSANTRVITSLATGRRWRMRNPKALSTYGITRSVAWLR